MSAKSWRERFSEVFAQPESSVAARAWAEVFGDEYPARLSPHSYVSMRELDRFLAEVRVERGGILADLGCGRGGPGLWVAANQRVRLVGIDIASTALDAARRRAGELGLGGAAEFRMGSFQDTGLPAASVDGAMSVDALLCAPDKSAAAVEMARILVPGGRLVLTMWDYFRQPTGRPPQVSDHRPLLEGARFDVLAYDETEQWRERQTRTGELMLRAVDELAAETGSDPADIRESLLDAGHDRLHEPPRPDRRGTSNSLIPTGHAN